MPDEVEMCLLPLSQVKESCGKWDESQDSMLTVWWWPRILLNRVQGLSRREGDSPGILLPVHTTTKRCCWAEESHNSWDGLWHVVEEKHVKDVLGKGNSHSHGRVSHQWVHNQGYPCRHPSQEVFWEKARPLVVEGFWKHSICASTRWHKAWSKVGEDDPHRLLTWAKGLSVLTPLCSKQADMM